MASPLDIHEVKKPFNVEKKAIATHDSGKISMPFVAGSQ